MKTNPPIILIDTNVWLDIYLPRRPGYKAAITFFKEALTRDVSLTYASHSTLDVYQKVRSDNKEWFRTYRTLTQADAIGIKRMAWDCVNEMRESATAVPIDATDIALACHFRDEHDDFEDALVMAACQRSRANYLVTNDTSLATHSPIEAKTPEEMTKLLRSGRAKGTPITSDANSIDWFYEWLSTYGQEDEG